MKRRFIRALWGRYGDDKTSYGPRQNMDVDLEYLKMSKYEKEIDVVMYVYGEENYKQIVDKGFKCLLFDKRPFIWDITQMLRHKLEIFKVAAEEYDEFVFLDIDCFLTSKLPENFWEKHYEKESIQASLIFYARQKLAWRTVDRGAMPCACYVYFRDKSKPNKLIKTWEEIGKPFLEERAMAKYTDDLIGGWQGIYKYCELFEPPFFTQSKVIDKKETQCFTHFHLCNDIKRSLENIKKTGNKPEWAV